MRDAIAIACTPVGRIEHLFGADPSYGTIPNRRLGTTILPGTSGGVAQHILRERVILMPNITQPTLELTLRPQGVSEDVEVRITYRIDFLEGEIQANVLYEERCQVILEDSSSPGLQGGDRVLNLRVRDDTRATSQSINRNTVRQFTRQQLNEDPHSGSFDELRARVKMDPGPGGFENLPVRTKEGEQLEIGI
jgi:hypothetical protein